MMKVMSERSELELLHEYQGRIVPKNHPVYSRIYAILRRLDGSIADMVAGTPPLGHNRILTLICIY